MKRLPHSEETERAVLAGVMVDAHSVLPRVCERLTVDDFYTDRNRTIFSTMLKINGSSVPDMRTVQAALEKTGDLEKVGGVAYLASLDLELPDVSRIGDYVEILKERSVRRQLVSICGDLTRAALGKEGTAGELVGGAIRSLTAAGESAVRSNFVPLGDAYGELMERLEDREENGFSGGLPTGFVDLDRKIHGLRPGNLVVLAGRPGMGKTTLAMNVAQNVALRAGKTVAVFSLEMSTDELALRVLCSEAQVQSERFHSGYVTQKDWQKVIEAARTTAAAPLLIDDSPYISATTLSSKVRSLHAERGVDLVVVDYLQLLVSGQGRHERRDLEVAAMTRGLKQLAKELAIPVLLVSQLSRATEKRGGDMRPRLSDLRESGAIEQDADLVAFIYRDEVYHEDSEAQGIAELILGKHRNGQTGTVRLVFDGGCNRFTDLARGGPNWSHGGAPAPF